MKFLIYFLVLIPSFSFAQDHIIQYQCHATKYVSNPWFPSQGSEVWDDDDSRFDAELTLLKRDNQFYGMIEVFKNESRQDLSPSAANRWRISPGEKILMRQLLQNDVPPWRKLNTNSVYLKGTNKVGSPFELSWSKFAFGNQEIKVYFNIEAIARTEDHVAYGTSQTFACRLKVEEYR